METYIVKIYRRVTAGKEAKNIVGIVENVEGGRRQFSNVDEFVEIILRQNEFVEQEKETQ